MGPHLSPFWQLPGCPRICRLTSLRCSYRLSQFASSIYPPSQADPWIYRNSNGFKMQKTQLEQKGGKEGRILCNPLRRQGSRDHFLTDWDTQHLELIHCRLECETTVLKTCWWVIIRSDLYLSCVLALLLLDIYPRETGAYAHVQSSVTHHSPALEAHRCFQVGERKNEW